MSICVYCTKDACPNHLCERCGRCSDCCECDVRLEEHLPILENAIEHPMEQALVDGVMTMTPPPLAPEQWAEPQAGHLKDDSQASDPAPSPEPAELSNPEPSDPAPLPEPHSADPQHPSYSDQAGSDSGEPPSGPRP